MSTREQIAMPTVGAVSSGLLQRKCSCGGNAASGGECESCKKKKLQRSAAAEAETDVAPPIVHDVLRSPGQPMDAASRAFFEPKFGHDFSKVRIHADSRASESAQAVQANAYTVGNDIVFANRSAASGDTRLMAHELTHVVQQAGAAAAGGLRVGPANSPQEHEAERVAGSVASSVASQRGNGSVAHSAASSVQRDGAPAPPTLDCGKDGRGLSAGERAAATKVFGPSLNIDGICIKESDVMTVGTGARTPKNDIYVHKGRLNNTSTALIIHELTHSWQFQHGITATQKLKGYVDTPMKDGTYDYGGEAGLNDAIANKKCMTQFTTEQQAEIVEDYYKHSVAGTTLYPWSVFVAQIRANGACIWPAPVEQPRQPGGGSAPA